MPEGVYINYYQLSAPIWPSEKHSCASKDTFVHKKGRVTGVLPELAGAAAIIRPHMCHALAGSHLPPAPAR